MSSLSYEPAHCAVCGHHDADVIANREDLHAELELLWAFHQRRLRPRTPPERLVDRVAFSERPPLRLVRCRQCGLLYRSPVERPHELAEIYGREAPTADALQAMHDTQRPSYREQARALRAVLGRGGAGIEIGSYVGAFLAVARESGLQMEGIDINPAVNAFTRSLGHVVHDATLDTFESDRTFDAVAIWNTFDQLAEPRAALITAHRLLRRHGVIALRVPNGAFYTTWRRRLFNRAAPLRATARALLAQNNLLTFPYRAGFTVNALTRLLDVTGFDVVHTRGDVLVPISDEWTRPWARIEERATKRALLSAIHLGATPPWIEVYGRRREPPGA